MWIYCYYYLKKGLWLSGFTFVCTAWRSNWRLEYKMEAWLHSTTRRSVANVIWPIFGRNCNLQMVKSCNFISFFFHDPSRSELIRPGLAVRVDRFDFCKFVVCEQILMAGIGVDTFDFKAGRIPPFYWEPCDWCQLPYSLRSLAVFKQFEVIYRTRETVFHRDIQTPRRELKIQRAAEYFLRNSRCLDNRWYTDSSARYIFSIKTKTKE